MKKKTLLWAGLAAGLRLSVPAAEVASIFADGMVLQQGMKVPVWGWGEPGEAVTVGFAGQERSAVAGESGLWRVELDPMPASFEPRSLAIRSSIGNQRSEVVDVLIGEVWLCSGQSNMGMGMAGVDNARQEMAAANFPAIRMFNVRNIPAATPRNQVPGEWVPCRPETMHRYSATGYYFARRVHQQTRSPVGIIVAAWGGSSVAAWMSPEALAAEPVRLDYAEQVLGWRINNRHSLLYNGMLHPLVPYAIAGAVWYQGESDAEPGANPYRYRKVLPAMIRDWRNQWGWDFPFYQVQLPGLSRPNDDWAVLRESQQEALKLPRTGMVVTLDIGQRNKLHPTNKKEFGERLADLVLQKEYGAEAKAESPLLKRARVEGGAIRATFEGGGAVLETTDGNAPAAFRIAGEDRNFVPAQAVIEGMDVVASSPQVPRPVALRYAWADFPEVNLCGRNGMPAGPFRTDNWIVQGENEVWKDLPAKARMDESFSPLEIADGEALGWEWCGFPPEPDAALRKECLRTHPAGLFLTVKPLWMRRPTEQRPILAWKTAPGSPLDRFDPEQGCTVVLHAEVSEGTDPFRGLDLELVLPRQDGLFYRHRLSIQPLRVCAHTDMEIRVLASDLDNTNGQRAYRLAVRPDGGVQAYFGSTPLGIVPGEPLAEHEQKRACFRWGKLDRQHRLDAKISRLEFDMAGGFGAPH